MGILAGVVDRARAFTRVGLNKTRRTTTTAAARTVHKAADAASEGAARLNRAADELRDESTGAGDDTGATR